MSSNLQPIVYGITEINGILARPSSRHIMEKAVQGHPIEVGSGNDYINLYHVFERMKIKNRKLRELVLVRRQIDESRWQLFVTSNRNDVPKVELEADYDPKRGRYKRYAEQLANGESVTFESRKEAIKARRAWQLYVPTEKRRHLKSNVRPARNGKHVVRILSRD